MNSKISPFDSVDDNNTFLNASDEKMTVPTKKNESRTVTDDPIDRARELIKDSVYFQIFVAISTLIAVFDCILVGYSPLNFQPNGFMFNFQVDLLIVSTILFWIGVYIIAIHIHKLPDKPVANLFEAIIESFDGEVAVEFVCLVFAWCTIYIYPGLAVLRCFRIFRFLWYFELFNQKEGSYLYRMLVKSCQLTIESLEMIAEELFTTNSNGGAVVLLLYFFTSYIFAVVYHSCLGDIVTLEGTTCSTLLNCFIVMLRLSFYDGTGFDYLTAVMDSGKGGFSFLLLVYLCFSAMILLNGLIGIFGMAFQKPESEEEDGGQDEEPKNSDILKELKAMREQMTIELSNMRKEIEELKS